MSRFEINDAIWKGKTLFKRIGYKLIESKKSKSLPALFFAAPSNLFGYGLTGLYRLNWPVPEQDHNQTSAEGGGP